MGERLSARGIGPNGVDVVFPTPIARERNAVAFGRPGWEDCVSPTYGERPDHVCLNVDNEQSDPTVLRHTLDESPSMWGPIRQTVVAVPSVMISTACGPRLGRDRCGHAPRACRNGIKFVVDQKLRVVLDEPVLPFARNKRRQTAVYGDLSQPAGLPDCTGR